MYPEKIQIDIFTNTYVSMSSMASAHNAPRWRGLMQQRGAGSLERGAYQDDTRASSVKISDQFLILQLI